MNQDFLQLLPPSLFDLSSDGENAKFWSLFADQMDEVAAVFEDLRLARDISSRSGTILDLIGGIVWESRSGKDDDEYRIYLLVAIQKMLCSGAEPDISNVFKTLLGDYFIGIRDLYPGSAATEQTEIYMDDSYYMNGDYYLSGSIHKPAFFDIVIKSETPDTMKNLSESIIPHLRGAGISCVITEWRS